RCERRQASGVSQRYRDSPVYLDQRCVGRRLDGEEWRGLSRGPEGRLYDERHAVAVVRRQDVSAEHRQSMVGLAEQQLGSIG
ncbi:hypothetical protein QMN58_31310, partial [Escherichia coli]|nr:hypothetical protein [Escherichia coli]